MRPEAGCLNQEAGTYISNRVYRFRFFRVIYCDFVANPFPFGESFSLNFLIRGICVIGG
jgi:hypothetical protein